MPRLKEKERDEEEIDKKGIEDTAKLKQVYIRESKLTTVDVDAPESLLPTTHHHQYQ